MIRVNLATGLAMTATLAIAAMVMAYVAYPYRGREPRRARRLVAFVSRVVRRVRAGALTTPPVRTRAPRG